MSATNRGGVRQPHDNYGTPPWCVHRLLEACPLPGGVWLEPCAGEGAIIRAVNEARPENAHTIDLAWHACDVRDECASPLADLIGAPSAVTICSYLAQPFEGADVIITNPPFGISFEIAQKAVSEASCVALLLRLNWLGSGERSGRSAWLRKHTPDVYVLPNRPEFCASLKCIGLRNGIGGCGWRVTQPLDAPRPKVCPACGQRVQCSTTDATEYAWFVWGLREQLARGGIHREASLRILAETPAAERKAVRAAQPVRAA